MNELTAGVELLERGESVRHLDSGRDCIRRKVGIAGYVFSMMVGEEVNTWSKRDGWNLRAKHLIVRLT